MTERQSIVLDDFLASACDGLDDERIAARAHPDLADVVTRAHAIDSIAVPHAWTVSARRLPPIAPDPAMGSASPKSAAEMGFFLDEVRGLLEEQAASSAPRAPATVRRVAQATSRARGRWTAAILAAAAIALFGLAVASKHWLAQAELQDAPREVAGDVAPGREAHELSVAPETTATRVPIAELPEVAPTPSAPSPAPILRASPRRGRAIVAPSPEAAPVTVEPTLEELEREAQRRWQAGDLAGARERFETITARGGRSSIAELAFGDLITLALRSKDPGRVRTAWSKYLARFPRGRYADDARAGLCRTASPAKMRACWQEYLDDWPKGAHRGEAREPSTP